MRILFLGGTRFIGPPAVARLRAAGHTVACFHRGSTATPPAPELAGVAHWLGDRRMLERHAAQLLAWAPDVVVDMVMRSDVDARAVQAVFAGHAARLVALSSADVYAAFGRVIGVEPGPVDPTPLTESSALRSGRYPYRGQAPGAEDYDKILGEAVVLGSDRLPGVVLRLPMVYGPRDYQYRFHDWLRRMDDGRPVIPVGNTFARWRCATVAVADVAAAVALAATHPDAQGVYNVAEPDAPTVWDWGERVACAAAWQGRIVAVPARQAPAAFRGTACDAQPVVLDSTRIRRELGYTETIGRATALAQAIAWQRACPPDWPAERFDDAAEDAAQEES